MKFVKCLDEHFEEACMAILLVLLACVMMAQVIARYVFKSSMNWPEEACRYFWVIITCFSISYVVRKKSALKVDLVVGMFPQLLQKIMLLVIDIGMVLVHVYMTYCSWITMLTIKDNGQLSPAMRMPMWYLYVFLVLGFGLGALRYVQTIVESLRGSGEPSGDVPSSDSTNAAAALTPAETGKGGAQ